MNKRTILAASGALLLLVLTLFVSCYPGDELTVSETDTVVTLFDKNVDFGTLTTYAMPDTIIHLVGEGDEDNVSRTYDQDILDQIASNLDALGFTRVDDPAAADVHVLTAATVRDYTGYAYYGGWWGYYYPGYPGWGWYPYYPSGGVAYSYSIGTIYIVMKDPHVTEPDGTIAGSPAWIAGLNGLVDRNTNRQRIENGIDQAFAQSKYLGTGK